MKEVRETENLGKKYTKKSKQKMRTDHHRIRTVSKNRRAD